MMETRKFYRQVFEVEVLSEGEPLNNVSLQDIDYEITLGYTRGQIKSFKRVVLKLSH